MLDLTSLLSARLFDLEQERFAGMPNHPNNIPDYSFLLHRHHDNTDGARRTPASGVVTASDHSGTHVDALGHQAEHMTLFGGIAVDGTVQKQNGLTELGAERIPATISRGVLIDVAGHDGVELLEPGRVITLADVQAVLDAQQTEIRRGDVVLLRTGYGSLWKTAPERYFEAPGVDSATSQWMADLGVSMVGADNASWDAQNYYDHELGTNFPGHVLLIVRKGIYIIEHLYLEELAAAGVHEFAYVSLPLKMTGATGAWLRPVALELG